MSVAGFFIPGLGYLNQLVNPLATNVFGRQFELSADKLALGYIKNTGLSKSDYVDFLHWVKANLENSSDSKTSLFSTHPATQERIDEILEN